MENTAHRKGLAAIIVAAILWSTGGVLIKLTSLNAIQLSSIRSLFAALTFLVIFRKRAIIINKAGLINAVFYAGILILFVSATKMTTAANAIFLQYTAPIYVLIFEPIINKTKYEKINIISSLFCFLGMGLFFFDQLTPGHLIGNILALISGVAFALFLLGVRKNSDEYQYSTVFYGNILITLIGMYSIGSIHSIVPRDIIFTIYLGVFQIGIAYAFFNFGLLKVLAIEASLISMVEPILNPVWVMIWYGEKPGNFAITGGAIIILSIICRTIFQEFNLRKKEPAG
ncbi:MAG: EamA family transporter [Bacteroidota bacterium]|nr:EamA family transporter [Bacteroidota bacterium]